MLVDSCFDALLTSFFDSFVFDDRFVFFAVTADKANGLKPRSRRRPNFMATSQNPINGSATSDSTNESLTPPLKSDEKEYAW